MTNFELIPRAPGHPRQPCQKDCPHRTSTCKLTCAAWQAYERDLATWRHDTHPENLFLTSNYTAAKESKIRHFIQGKKRHYH